MQQGRCTDVSYTLYESDLSVQRRMCPSPHVLYGEQLAGVVLRRQRVPHLRGDCGRARGGPSGISASRPPRSLRKVDLLLSTFTCEHIRTLKTYFVTILNLYYNDKNDIRLDVIRIMTRCSYTCFFHCTTRLFARAFNFPGLLASLNMLCMVRPMPLFLSTPPSTG